MNCYFCGVELTAANNSPEHIIQKAIGGAIVGWELLCRSCNSGPASRIDNDFVRFTSYLYRMVLQARPTSRVSDSLIGITDSGEEVRFGPNMVMDTKVEIALPDGQKLAFTAPPDEAEKKAFKRLNQFQGKFPQIDPKRMIANAQRGKVKLDELVYFTNHDAKQSKVGGPEFFRGIKKIAVNFYLSKKHPQHYVQDVIEQVREGRPANRVISTFHYPMSHTIHELGEKEISHVMKLVGDPDLGVLYFYIELFNTSHSLILLNRYYYGPAIEEQYCYDVLTGVELEKPIKLLFGNRLLMLKSFDHEWNTNPQAEVAYRRTRKILEDSLRAKGLIV